MWRRLSINLRTLAPTRSVTRPTPFAVRSPAAPGNLIRSLATFSRHFATESVGNATAIRVEDVMPIATGHEREELEAELKGKDLLEINYPSGPFGTKEEPAVIQSYYSKRIVGCPGAEGEDEHDVVWFWLEQGKPHECPVCSQYFVWNKMEIDDCKFSESWKWWAQADLRMDMEMTRMIIIIFTEYSWKFAARIRYMMTS